MSDITGTSINIPTILSIGAGALKNIGLYLKESGIKNCCIFYGNGLIDMFGSDVHRSLKDAGIDILSYQELDDGNIEELVHMAFELPNKTQAVVGIGGGKVIDSTKYMGFLRKIPFISCPTSSSSDGFSSSTASLLVEGRRKSCPAAMPFGIIVDTDVISTAPERFIYSGIGDMVSKITANYDWLFEDAHGVTRMNDCAVMIAKKAVNSFVLTQFETIHDTVFLKSLLDSLAMSGIANEIAGSSAPTSGSEHLISHALDAMAERPQLHGVQVGVATYLMALVQDHRWQRVKTIFTDTGFFEYVKTLNLDVAEYERAIDMAPSIKPSRHTYLHEEEYREAAKKLLHEDEILKEIFHL